MPRGIYPRPSVEDRIKNNIVVDPKTGCCIWTGGIGRGGYGLIWYDGKMVYVHRLAYEQHTGQKIPEGECVLHKCDNPPCCNPDHLRLGTNKDNSEDMVKKRRQARGEKNSKAKLIKKQVIEIRASPKSQTQLAEEYGVSRQLIGMIKRCEVWRHL